MMATLVEFSLYFIVSKRLILAYFWGTNLTNYLVKICWHFNCVKICEFFQFLKFLTF